LGRFFVGLSAILLIFLGFYNSSFLKTLLPLPAKCLKKFLLTDDDYQFLLTRRNHYFSADIISFIKEQKEPVTIYEIISEDFSYLRYFAILKVYFINNKNIDVKYTYLSAVPPDRIVIEDEKQYLFIISCLQEKYKRQFRSNPFLVLKFVNSKTKIKNVAKLKLVKVMKKGSTDHLVLLYSNKT
jgi:hypothetical protein